ncbi:hypothetical protein ACV229_20610 [Burkholderia sp. MR1-5-21]
MSFEENDFEKAYEYGDLIRNTGVALIDGVECAALLSGFDEIMPILADVEAMMHEIEFDKSSAGFVIQRDSKNRLIIKAMPFGKRYWTSVMLFFERCAFDERYVFSPHVEALRDAFIALDLHPAAYPFHPLPIEVASGKTPHELFNDVLANAGEIVSTPAFRRGLGVRMRRAKRNEEQALAVERQVFENKSRQLVLMLHFGYGEEYRSKITLKEIRAHRKKFFNNCRTNKLLRGIIDYIWKIEEGDESGLHLHVLIFYSAESCRDVQIARLIGEYWKNVVTGGKGQYWNSNADKVFHAKYGHGVGTGEINWDDHETREALRTNIRYMTKADQFLRMKYGDHCRLFGTSQVEEKKKSGRPRTVKPKLDCNPAGNSLTDSYDPDSLDNAGADATDLDADQNESMYRTAWWV